MVQNNKVLTVSYGTFSCTLEGFDDSFETMKAIAEYFRDLAAEDRYFGSEPPQPDADMLARIARRNASRHVEARPSENGVLLRAADRTPSTAPQATARAQMAAPTPDLGVVPPATTHDTYAPAASPAPASEDSIAAKLQRIRAVVSHGGERPTSYSEDEETGFLATRKPQVDAISAAFEAGALDPADLNTGSSEQAPQDTAAPAEADTKDGPEQEQVFVEPNSEAEADLDLSIETEAEAPAEGLRAETAPAQPEVVEPEVAAEAPEADEADEEAASEALFADLEGENEAEAEPDEIRNILSEVIEASADAADTSDDAEPRPEQGILTPDEEEFILNEISEIEAEMEPAIDQPRSGDSDPDVLRLMEKIDAQLDDPEITNQRETYSHLRTAVVAAEAEREVGGKLSGVEDETYRKDLASVVSPRRPEIQVTSMRPESDSAAPLKLVAEQRIDSDAADNGPVTPRRVTTAQVGDDSDEAGFAHFAREQGAQSLSDLLEAAAAYLSFIEGQEKFSRPQLMNKVRSLKQEDFNREESLRSFGQLLRDGKIEKAGGGRFSASNQIGFRPDDKRAAG
ncbi:putative lipoprotein [Ruegeria lacuscaerulensis ITI-1157]|nr:putative lipoprotein [Ruegeria lacuscaerulensis ITI-1157]SHJ04503.1 hypothetical protein SAMN05444404_1291 [Ruegeria lacuscaerulensis ITI-1157]